MPGSLGPLCLRSVHQANARKMTNSTAKTTIQVTVASLCSRRAGTATCFEYVGPGEFGEEEEPHRRPPVLRRDLSEAPGGA